jgi:hypothetical protein
MCLQPERKLGREFDRVKWISLIFSSRELFTEKVTAISLQKTTGKIANINCAIFANSKKNK